MNDNQDKPDYFQYRWGVKEWDVGFTTIPNPVLKHYSKVPWTDKDGKCGYGISNQEMMCIIHLASFHFESEEGESRPATGTVAKRMGYRKDDSVRGLTKSLEHKNLLTIERPPGKCNVYDLTNFSRAILEIEDGQPPHPNGGHADGGLSDGDHFHGDEEEKIIKEAKQEEEKQVEKKSIASFSEDQPRKTLADPTKLELERATASARAESGGDIATPAAAGGADALAAFGLFCLYDKRGKSPPKPGTKEHTQQREKVREALRAYDYQQTSPELIEKAAEIHCERKGQWVNVFYRSFVADFGEALQDAEYFLKHGCLPDDGNRQKGTRHGPHQRHIAPGAAQRRVATEEEARRILG